MRVKIKKQHLGETLQYGDIYSCLAEVCPQGVLSSLQQNFGFEKCKLENVSYCFLKGKHCTFM